MTGIQLQFYSNHNGNMFGEITDDHIRAILESARMEALAHIHLDRTLGLVAEARRREVICRILRSLP